MTPAEILDRAADEMERRGKAEAELTSPNGSICAIGALCLAVNEEMWINRPFQREVRESLRTFIGDEYCLVGDGENSQIWRWNDSSDAPTVIAGLRAVAATLRAQAAAEPISERVTA